MILSEIPFRPSPETSLNAYAAVGILPLVPALLISFLPAAPAPEPSYTKHEVPLETRCEWLGFSSFAAQWRSNPADLAIRTFTLYLGLPILNRAETLFGSFDPAGDGHWLGCSLMPRRRPASAATYDDRLLITVSLGGDP